MALKSANHPIRWKERIGIMAVGYTFKRVEELFFDFTLYPAVIAWLGAVTGGLVMTVFSAVVCYLYIRFYDWAKKDWLGVELVKEMRDGSIQHGRIKRLVQRLACKGDGLAFFALSCYTDPFITTVYLRKGVEAYNGLSTRDWKVFWASVFVANLWWTSVVSLAVEGFRYLARFIGFS